MSCIEPFYVFVLVVFLYFKKSPHLLQLLKKKVFGCEAPEIFSSFNLDESAFRPKNGVAVHRLLL